MRPDRNHLCLAVTAAAAALAGGCAGVQSVVDPRGPQAERIADLWWVFFGICAAVFAGVTIALVVALLPRASRRSGGLDPARETRARRTVAGAVGLTIVILLGLVTYSAQVSRAITASAEGDPGAVVIDVVGHQWWWEVQYAGAPARRSFTTANELRIPVGRPVIVRGTSRDVIHSFWVPNLHGKVDFIPGRVNTIWFEASEPGTWRGQCAEFCGLQHAKMALTVVAMPDGEFDSWREASSSRGEAPVTSDSAARGRQVFLEQQCAMCHTIRGTGAFGHVAPDLTRIGSRTTLAAGTMPNTRGHLAAWILDPQGIKPGSFMPPTYLEPQDLHALLDYLEGLE